MIECSKCNFKNADDAVYCASCGKPLNEEKALKEETEQEYLCPRCRVKFIGKKKFCDKCGLEFNWPEGDINAIPIKLKKTKKEKVDHKVKKHIDISFGVIDYIFYGFTFLAIILAIVGVWLPFGKVLNVSSSELGCKYWFDNFWL